jgi:hypothetical protein
MIRDLLKWLACSLVAVLGLALLAWGPFALPDGKGVVGDGGRSALAAAAEARRGVSAPGRAQP